MRFEAVLPALRAGKFIRCKDNDEVFFYLLDGDLVRQAYIPAYEEWIVCDHSITGKEVLRDDWEVMIDGKPCGDYFLEPVPEEALEGGEE